MLPKTRQPSSNKIKVTLRIFRTVAFLFLFTFSFCVVTRSVHAQPEVGATTPNSDQFGVAQVGEKIAIPASPNADLRVLIVRIINVILGFLGLVAVCIVLYAGYLWMTSGGNEETVAVAKKMLVNGAIGLAIIIAAFTITSFILRSLLAAINGGGFGNSNAPSVQTYSFSGSLGSIIKDHYPRRDQRGVPRNTSIVVTFGIPVNPATLIENTNRTCWNSDVTKLEPSTDCKTKSGDVVTPTTALDQIQNPYYGDCTDLNSDNTISTIDECDQVNTKNIIIDEKSKFPENNSSANHTGLPAAGLATYDVDRNAFTFVFRPREYLGSSTEDVTYRVQLTTALMRSDTGKGVFETQFSQGYLWDFTTGNFLDLDPPTVVEVYPKDNATVPRNSIIQITFSEPIDPTVVEGVITDTSAHISTVLNRKPNSLRLVVPGSWRLSNGYTTLEFISSEPCGTNSCGQQMFCLPVTCTAETCSNQYEALLRTAKSTNNAEAPFEAYPFSGIYDLAFNGLDTGTTNPQLLQPLGSRGVLIEDTEKTPDNYPWDFKVSNTIDRSSPYIEEILPGVDAEDVSGDAPVYVQFSNRMRQKTLEDISFEEYPTNICADAALPPDQRTSPCKKLDTLWYRVGSNTVNEKTKTNLQHREFGPNNLDLYYIPSVPSTVQNVTQNCVYPGRGPFDIKSAPQNTPSTCAVATDAEGNFVSGVGCASVTLDPDTDTACVFTPPSSNNLLGTIPECVNKIHEESQSSY